MNNFTFLYCYILILNEKLKYFCSLVVNGETVINCEFLNEVDARKDEELVIIPDNQRKDFKFQKELYTDAVVMPWYRNQDFPQVI